MGVDGWNLGVGGWGSRGMSLGVGLGVGGLELGVEGWGLWV